MKHITHIRDLGVAGVAEVLARATRFRARPPGAHLSGRLLSMVFFNASLRTRASFEAVMKRGGGDCTVLEVGNGVWQLETRDGVVMDGERAEHVREAVPVLARYADALAVRCFAAPGSTPEADDEDAVIAAFRRHSSVPVISMESAREHPCQGLADLLTVQQRFGLTRGQPVTLTWAPHIKPLPRAVPNSFLLTAAAAGCEVRIAHPEGFALPDSVLDEAAGYAQAAGGSLTVTHDQQQALAGSRVLYAKAWGPAQADPATLTHIRELKSWMPTRRHAGGMAEDAVFMHCLPTRRGVEVADEVLDHAWSAVTDQAANRFDAQRALLDLVFNG